MILESIIGLWIFQSMSQGQNEIPSNPIWELRFEFQENGTNTLFYKRQDEDGFCERQAAYEYANEELVQQVIWVNPDNAPWCGSDVDMQLGHWAKNRVTINGDELDLYLPFPGEEIVYHWKKKITKQPDQPKILK